MAATQLDPSNSYADRPQSTIWSPYPKVSGEAFSYDHNRQLLYIDFKKSCHTSVRISSWEKGMRVYRWNPVMEFWDEEESDPGISFPLAQNAKRSSIAFEDFAATIPAHVRDAVCRFSWRQFVMLKMVWLYPDFLDLVQSNPVLAWLLADAIAAREIKYCDVGKLIALKRRDILAFCTGLDSNAIVKALSKICGTNFNQDTFIDVRMLLKKTEWMDYFRHCKKIEARLLRIIPGNPLYAIWVTCLPDTEIKKVLSGTTDVIAGQIFDDTWELANNRAAANSHQQLMDCRSLEALEALHNEWVEVINNRSIIEQLAILEDKYGTKNLPFPPFPGTEHIQPIRTIEELLEEGAIMHNCVASYLYKAMDKECFLYRVLEPERATLEIGLDNGSCTIRQLKIVCNGSPSQETRTAVQDYFHAEWCAKEDM